MKLKIHHHNDSYPSATQFFSLVEKVLPLCIENTEVLFSVDVIYVDNESIQKMNDTYRKINKETDVLSFPMMQAKNGKIQSNPFDVDPETDRYPLGDIVISIEKAYEQAKEYDHAIEREVAFLICHGMLHLLGYDHQDKKAEKDMLDKQKEILDGAGYIR